MSDYPEEIVGNPGGYESIKAMCAHYIDILTSAKIGVRENYQSPGHLIKMLKTVEAGVLSDSQYGKWMRWLGYVQGIMVSDGLLDVTEERDRSRKLLSRLDHEFDNVEPDVNTWTASKVAFIQELARQRHARYMANAWIENDKDGFTGWRWDKYNRQLRIVCAANRYKDFIVTGNGGLE